MLKGILDSNSKIITSGSILNLDASQLRSYSGTGTSWNDLSGNNINGTLNNGPTFSSTAGGTIVFDGTNDSVTTSSNILDLTNLTICAWVKFDSTSNTAYPTITNKETSNLARNWWLGIAGTFAFGRSVSGTDTAVISTVTPSLNTWYHVSATNDTTPVFKIYINGALNNTTTTSGTLSTNGTTGWIGSYRDYLYPMNGNISVVQFYNRVLSATEILQNYNVQKTRFGL